MADVREVESELGGLVYQSLGTVGFSHPEEAADFPVPPGYAKLVAVSSLYGLTVFADHVGLCGSRAPPRPLRRENGRRNDV